MTSPRAGRARRILPALALLLAACAAAPGPPPAPSPAPPRALDLTHVLRQDVPYLAGEPQTTLLRDADGRLRAITVGARTGTAVELLLAPGAPPLTLDLLAPGDLVLPAAVLDLRERAQDDPAFALSPEDVLAWEREHGPVEPGELVLLVTGWDIRWGDPAAYLGAGPDGRPRAPGFSPAAARLLLDERGAAGLGLDGPGAVPPPASGQRLLLTNLTSLEQLPPRGATVVIGALKAQAAQSSPARVLALLR